MKARIEYHGVTPATGIKHFEVYRTRDLANHRPSRRIPRGDTWRLMRVAPGSAGGVEAFETAELAMKWGSKLNPTVVWQKVTL
jgi:hypothetical protein